MKIIWSYLQKRGAPIPEYGILMREPNTVDASSFSEVRNIEKVKTESIDALNENEKVWFTVTTGAPSVSGKPKSHPDLSGKPEQIYRLIEVYKIPDEILEIIEKDHNEYCKQSGRPLLHGSVLLPVERTISKKVDFKTIQPDKDGGFDLAKGSLLNAKTFCFAIPPEHIADKCKKLPLILTPNDISNFIVSTRVTGERV